MLREFTSFQDPACSFPRRTGNLYRKDIVIKGESEKCWSGVKLWRRLEVSRTIPQIGGFYTRPTVLRSTFLFRILRYSEYSEIVSRLLPHKNIFLVYLWKTGRTLERLCLVLQVLRIFITKFIKLLCSWDNNFIVFVWCICQLQQH